MMLLPCRFEYCVFCVEINILHLLKLFKKMNMKDYKVETLIYYSKLTFDFKHITKSSKKDIQNKLDEYVTKGYRLVSTDMSNFGSALYIYLYFEKE
jgi:hypothetical protein